jgi:ABC-type enterochelin transport system permease subunit
MYSIFWHIHYHETVSEEEALKEIQKEIEREGKSQIPVILFGIGIFITKLNEKIVKQILPYLMFALVFGTIIPEFTNFLIFDYNDIKRITIAGEIDFSFIVMSYGFLFISILLTTVFYLKNK